MTMALHSSSGFRQLGRSASVLRKSNSSQITLLIFLVTITFCGSYPMEVNPGNGQSSNVEVNRNKRQASNVEVNPNTREVSDAEVNPSNGRASDVEVNQNTSQALDVEENPTNPQATNVEVNPSTQPTTRVEENSRHREGTDLDRCMYKCYSDFIGCYEFSSHEEVEYCVSDYNSCFFACYTEWW